MKIEITGEHAENFNRIAEYLLLLLQPIGIANQTQQRTLSSQSSSHRKLRIDLSEISSISTYDVLGKETAKQFQTQKGPVGLSENDYPKFIQFAIQIQETVNLKDLVSLEFIKTSIFEWLKNRYKRILSSTDKFSSFLQERIQDEIKTRKVSIPILYLEIKKPFNIGNVTFEFYKEDFFDKYAKHAQKTKGCKISDENPQNFVNEIKKRYQGIAFASIQICAETHKCIEIAKEEVKKALMVLRFFSLPSFFPEIPSYFGIMGKASLPTSYFFIFENEFPKIIKQVDEKREFRHILGTKELKYVKDLGIDHASKLISKTNLSELEEILLKSIFLFDKSVVSKEFQDKLVFTLVSIETLLLKTVLGSIRKTIELRLASLVKCKATKEEISNLIKLAYKYRGAYLHHGKRWINFELLKNLQNIVWSAIQTVLTTMKQYSTQDELIEFLDSQMEGEKNDINC